MNQQNHPQPRGSLFANAFMGGIQQSQSVLGGGAIGGITAGVMIGANLGKTITALLTNPLTAIPTAAAATIGALAGLTVATKTLAESFKEFSPSLTGIFAGAEVRQIMRSQRVGEAVAPNVGPLIDSLEDLKDAFEPMLIDIVKGAASLSRGFTEIVTAIQPAISSIWDEAGNLLAPIKETLKEIYKFMTGKEWKDPDPNKPIHLGPGWGVIDPKRPAAFRPQAGARL